MARRSTTLRRLLVVGAAVVGFVALIVVGLYALVVFVLGEAPGWTTATEVCRQPDTVRYEDGSSYAVYVREPSLSLSLSSGPSLAVVSRSGNGSYGVFIELNPSTDPDLVTCRWQPDRVEIVEPNGIVHAVPASVFTGGR